MTDWVYGRHAVYHLLRAGRRKVYRLYLLKGSEMADDPLFREAERRGLRWVTEVPRGFGRWNEVAHQGVLAETEVYPYVPLEGILDSASLLLLDGLQDPQNLGALCRSAQILGVAGIILPQNRACPVTPAVCKAAAGAMEYLKVARVTSLAPVANTLKKNGFWVYGADPGGGKGLFEEKFPEKVALIVGGEGRGLGRLVRERCDVILSIPMSSGEIGSFNAASAGALILGEILRQRSLVSPKSA